MGQKWQDATVCSHTVLVAQNRVHHWNGIKNFVLAEWLSCHIILCIHSEGRFDVISRSFPDSTMSWPQRRCAVWENSTDPITDIYFLYILTVPHTWPILLGLYFWYESNSALCFVLQVLHGNVQWYLAISGPSMATISRSNTIIPLMSHMTRAGFSMAFRWYAFICVKSTVWESISISSHYSTISPSYTIIMAWQ